MLVGSSFRRSEFKSPQDCLGMGQVHSEVPSRVCSGLKSAEKPVTARGTGQARFKYPESVLTQAAASL
eukprot:6187586-Pleurochrysis_carterae.AAC.2